MNRFLFLLICFPVSILAQKKPLDHSVYDGWQNIGEKLISNDGKWVVYTITSQEGDASLFIQSTGAGTSYKKEMPRGYNARITEDNKYVVFKIRPSYQDTRNAKIKKKRPEDFPKDSLGLVELGKDNIFKTDKIKSYKLPLKAGGWIAYQKEPIFTRQSITPTQQTVDSLKRAVDSLTILVKEIKNIQAGNQAANNDAGDADDDPPSASATNEGSDLVIRQLNNNKERLFKNVADYYFNSNGEKLVLKIVKSLKDSLSKNGVLLYNLQNGKLDTILKGGNDFKGFALTEDGDKVAFVAERSSNPKALQKFYQLYLYRNGDDSAKVLVNKETPGMEPGTTVSEFSRVGFSKSGNRLFFGTAPVQTPKDTSLIDIDLVKLDIWNYKDDYLQTQQLFNLQNELKRNYLAIFDFTQNKMKQLGSKGLPNVFKTNEGDGNIFIGVTDTGRRVEAQWTSRTKKDIYSIDITTGKRTLVKNNLSGNIDTSTTGKYIIWYDDKAKNYFAWDGTATKNITQKIKVPLYDEENDVPSDPSPYGVMGWSQDGAFVYIYDRYDIWKVDPTLKSDPVNITLVGRKQHDTYKYIRVDSTEKYLPDNQPIYLRVFNQEDKKSGIVKSELSNKLNFTVIAQKSPYSYSAFLKSRNSDQYIYTKENYTASPDLYFTTLSTNTDPLKLTSTNPQQASYNWGTAQLYKWKTFDGKAATGILYKPEDFDSTKKYPMLIYFYEKLSDNLYQYNAPAPTPSRLNISFFVSRGYLVFTPDISYTKGHPAKDAYNYIVSGAQALSKNKWVDAKSMGLQGQSWGGYQVAALITQTGMFKAAWSGAPVANMFSAYGGVRWESGVTRQFQYEKGQSRIGASIWERPDLYIENSPLFHLQKVTTPLVIMSNDADGAVPWYQGIEFFTAMRRLNKKVWLLSYNGEAHNLVERKNRKDIQIREQQYFDWMLKGAKPALWLTEGLPAVEKGRHWGLEMVDGIYK